jgi:hypothetical protein
MSVSIFRFSRQIEFNTESWQLDDFERSRFSCSTVLDFVSNTEIKQYIGQSNGKVVKFTCLSHLEKIGSSGKKDWKKWSSRVEKSFQYMVHQYSIAKCREIGCTEFLWPFVPIKPVCFNPFSHWPCRLSFHLPYQLLFFNSSIQTVSWWGTVVHLIQYGRKIDQIPEEVAILSKWRIS